MAAVLGGTQSLHTNSFDEALSLPTEEAVRIALRTQQIIADETGVINTVDPVGGPEIIEHLTNEIEEKALAYIQKIDEQGGVIACIQNGYLQREIQASSFEYQKKVEAKEEIIVGVNKFTIEKEEKIKTQKISPTLEKKQIEKLKKFKKSRSSHTVAHALSQIKKGAASKENLIPAILEAVESYATLGEISDAMREVFGTYKENVTL